MGTKNLEKWESSGKIAMAHQVLFFLVLVAAVVVVAVALALVGALALKVIAV